MRSKRTVSLTVEREGQEVELTVTGVVSPGHPGRTSGPPEKCEPPESDEVDIVEILTGTSKWEGELTDNEHERAFELLCEAYHDDDGCDPPDDDDHEDDREWTAFAGYADEID